MSIAEQFAVQWALEQAFMFRVLAVMGVLWGIGLWRDYRQWRRENE